MLTILLFLVIGILYKYCGIESIDNLFIVIIPLLYFDYLIISKLLSLL